MQVNYPLVKTLQRHPSDSQGTLKLAKAGIVLAAPLAPLSHSAPATPASLDTQALPLPRTFALALPSVWKGFCPHTFRFLFPHLLLADAFPGVVDRGYMAQIPLEWEEASSGSRNGRPASWLLLPSSRTASAEEGHTSFQGQPYPTADQHSIERPNIRCF